MSEFMEAALKEAEAAAARGEVPVGAVVVCGDRIVAQAGNRTLEMKDPTAHAELLAIREACTALGNERLTDCDLYVTLEPCPMCAGAIIQSRIPLVIYGTPDEKAGACHSLFQITSDTRLNHQSTVISGVMQEECRSILQEFFRRKRAEGKK